MNETLLGLVYFLSGGLAFAATRYWRWRGAIAVIAGGLITVIGWILVFVFTEAENRPDWVRLDVSLNLTFGLIFAIAGALLGRWLLSRRGSTD